ncbi:MAG: threonine--tRNA ligase [Spirochaetes bacterium]|nr:MAG: threonine--tRNA ligase [Spirochaetota bacterium]
MAKIELIFKNDKVSINEGSAIKDIIDDLPVSKNRLIAIYISNRIYDFHTPIDRGGMVLPVYMDDPKGLEILRHSTSHVMAQAVKHLFTDVKLAIGPAIKDGFYYDFDFSDKLTSDDLPKIEEEMKKIIDEDQSFERYTMSRSEAIDYFKKKGEVYKVELIETLEEGEEISFYKNGDFVDLCRGPHLPSTSYIKAFKLLNVAGAYWHGDERNPMLTRIYGTAFFDKKDLKKYLYMIEEAKKRDHRKLGKELDLFSFHDEGPGFPFWLPNGIVIKNTLLDYWREEHRNAGYVEVQTPVLLKKDLWVKSGHWDNYRENMYITEIDDYPFAIKPMNCPGGMLIYKEKIHSYRDLPMRVAEVGHVHRHEKSGVLQGLFRVRAFTQDDAHIFMLPSQIEEEIIGVIELTDRIYSKFGFNYTLELSTRPEKSIGTDEQWDITTRGLENALIKVGKKYSVSPGEGAFYGPKIDFHLEDCLGRLHQCATIQVDMSLPERFDLTYIDSDGTEKRPVVIHRAILGSLERFIGILVEHYGGRFPVWLSPVQVVIMPITERHIDASKDIYNSMFRAGLRVELDSRNEKLGYKMREAELKKVPYIVVVGDREIENKTISVRKSGKKDLGSFTVNDFINRVSDENIRRIDYEN